MKRKNNSLCIIILLIILLATLSNSMVVIKTVRDSFYLFINKIFPTLFTFFIISDLLIYYDFSSFINKIFKNKLNYLFKIKKESVHVFIISMISGFPGSSKYIKDLLDKKIILIKDASKLLTFTHFSNPLFIIGTIGAIFLKSNYLGFLILISHYSGGIITGILFRNYTDSTNNYNNNSINLKEESFIKILSNSILNSLNTLTLIFGIITIFALLNNLFITYLPINTYLKVIMTGLLELTNGLTLLSKTNLNIFYKSYLSLAFISFGGFCVHLQVFGILNDYHLNYFLYFTARIIHVLISISLLFILFSLLY